MKEEILKENRRSDYTFLSIQEIRWCQKREMENIFSPFLSKCQVRESHWTHIKAFQLVALDGRT